MNEIPCLDRFPWVILESVVFALQQSERGQSSEVRVRGPLVS